jgi:hypothetical protein
MDDKIEGEGNTALLEPIENAEFLRVRFCAADFVGELLARGLKTQLNVVEAGFDKGTEPSFIERHARGDQADVEARGASGAHQLDKVGPGERLPAREIGLEHPVAGSFTKDAGPDFGGEFVAASLQFERIGTIDAMERTSMSEFGDEGERVGYRIFH